MQSGQIGRSLYKHPSFTQAITLVATPPSYLALVSQSRLDDSAAILATSLSCRPWTPNAHNFYFPNKEV